MNKNIPMESKVYVFSAAEEAASALAKRIASFCKRKGKERNITIALSGGSTPKLLFRTLASLYGNVIDWERVHFFWVDERCVAEDDPESNYGMTKGSLFDAITIPERNIHRIRGEEDPEEEALRYAKEVSTHVRKYKGFLRFDFMLLGIGDDGHTASIFPNDMSLLKAETNTAVSRHPVTGQQRITLTGNVICNAREIIFFVTGASKAGVVREILLSEKTQKKYPAGKVKALNGLLLWYLDDQAAIEYLGKKES